MIRPRTSGSPQRQSGVDTVRTKLLAFMIGAVYAGLAGASMPFDPFISPDSFSGTQAILLMTMLIVGAWVRSSAASLAQWPDHSARGVAVPRSVVSRALWPRRHRRHRAGAGRLASLASLPHASPGERTFDPEPIIAARDDATVGGLVALDASTSTYPGHRAGDHRPKWLRQNTLLNALSGRLACDAGSIRMWRP